MDLEGRAENGGFIRSCSPAMLGSWMPMKGISAGCFVEPVGSNDQDACGADRDHEMCSRWLISP